jgi:dipeptidyl aminopeptidase/acylaminoacyl peptidase
MEEKYKAAERLLPWNVVHAVLNGEPQVTKLDDGHFYYGLEERKDGVYSVRFRKVSTADGSECDLFDHAALCRKLDTEVLPFESCTVKEGHICFVYDGYNYDYDPETDTLEKKEYAVEQAVSVSPDETKEIFVRDHDLWMRDRSSGKETRMTWDGEKDFAYGKCAEFSGYITARLQGLPEKPGVLWSPDSKKFLTYKTDQRSVKDLYILQSFDDEHLESIRPRLHTYKCPFPEDEHIPLAYYYMGDAETCTVKKIDMEPQYIGGALFTPYYGAARWLQDSSAVYTTLITRGNKSASFYLIESDGTAREIMKETSDTALNIHTWGNLDGYNDYCASNFLSEDRKTLLWQSERDDLARLFRYDPVTGELMYPVTPADCAVGELIGQDDENEYVYFYASNLAGISDLYYQLVCRVHYDGTGFEILTPEDGMHRCTMINDILIDTWSRVDLPPVTVLRKTDGTLIRELIRADISDLLERGYILPERFTVKADDGKTDLYGILIRPKDLKDGETCPFVDYIYGGMQCYNVPKAFAYDGKIEGREIMGGLEELAQIGFAGIILDGMGTPGRGRKLHSVSYENIHGCAGLKDHVYCLKELKEKYPFLDLDRAGIWGNSGGGCATSRAMLEYPDVYKVGVSSAGNHDQRMYNTSWTENYYGLYNRDIYIKGDNTSLAKNLKGHLYIVHGAMDDNVAMSQSIRLIDALIAEDKDFDFLILPRTNHNVPANPYFIRRKIDYFVRYLMQEEVPSYRFVLPEE